jgi:hypothetical protein
MANDPKEQEFSFENEHSLSYFMPANVDFSQDF